jgi:hypothetical protein
MHVCGDLAAVVLACSAKSKLFLFADRDRDQIVTIPSCAGGQSRQTAVFQVPLKLSQTGSGLSSTQWGVLPTKLLPELCSHHHVIQGQPSKTTTFSSSYINHPHFDVWLE